MKLEAADFTGVRVEETNVDYPVAWRTARSVSFDEHHLKCSYRTQQGGVLCDCHVLYPEQLTRITHTAPHAAGYVAALSATVARLTKQRDEARDLVRGVESEDGNFGLLEYVARWNAEKETP